MTRRKLLFIGLGAALLAAYAGAQSPKDYRAVIADIDNYAWFRTDSRAALRKGGDRAAALLIPLIERRLQETKTDKRPEVYLGVPIDALCECATITQTAKVRGLYNRIQDPATRDRLLGWMGRIGDARACRDLLEERLVRETHPNPAASFRVSMFTKYLSAEDLVIGLVRSADARSIRLLVSILQDRQAKDYIRGHVFQNLAATGDGAAIRALKAVRAGSRQRGRLPFVASLDFGSRFRPTPIKGTHVDATGTEWGLVEWDALGSLDDVWLVRKQGSQWVKPVYTGVNAYWDTPEFGMVDRTGANADQAASRPLIEGGGWIKAFVGNKELELDSDGDGFTDIVEKRFGLDPQLPDTDGDGLNDSLDKNPHTPKRVLSEKQQILKAAIDAMVVGRSSNRLAFFELPADVKPFEVTSWNGLVLPSALGSKYVRGSLFRVGLPYLYSWTATGVQPPVFQFSKDRKTVQVLVSESHSGAETNVVTLKRFGEDWLPIRVEEVSHIVS